MEALEKDFQDLVASEEQEILDAVEPIQEDPVVEEETEEVLEQEEIDEILAEDDQWTDPSQEDIELHAEIIADLQEQHPDIDFTDVELAIGQNEDGEMVVEILKGLAAALRRRKNAKILSKKGKGYKIVDGKAVKMSQKEILARSKAAQKAAGKRKPSTKKRKQWLSFDQSEVASDDAVVMGEEQQDVQEYTAGVQARPTNVLVWRTIGGELKKVRRWTSKGKKGINKGPKSAAHKTAISKAMLRAWKPGGAARKAAGKAEESVDYIDALGNGET